MFTKGIALGVVALAAAAIVGPAVAAGPTGTATANVNITIEPTVSVWANNANLDLNGANAPDNDAAVASSIGYINNVDAQITASVAGISNPANTVAGGGIQFHIFNATTDIPGALAAIHANGYTPAGAISFNAGSGSAPQVLVADTGINTSAVSDNVIYAAGLPGDLPLPGTTTAVVTYTISQANNP